MKHSLSLPPPRTTSGTLIMSVTDAIKQPELDDNFKHSPLDLKYREIRLLKLVSRSEDKEHINAVIQHFNLSEAPSFNALSYTWGQTHPLFSIYINGKPFSVRQNLSAFLKTVGSDPEFCTDEWLWIDQVCIQQTNVGERNHQVQQMPEIYRSASEVIVWLGLGTVYSKYLLREVAEVNENPTSWSNLTTRAAVQLLGCEYWTRTWIIQEFILAPSMVFYWGTTKFGFDDLEVILKIGGQRIRDRHCQANSLLPKITHISELIYQKSISRQDGFVIRDWKNALTLSSLTNCQDVRDRIYALLGLVDPKIAIYPNYAASPKDIFIDILAGVALQYSNLHLEVSEQVDFLAAKALVSRALGLGNRPLDELRWHFFNKLRNDNQCGDNTYIDFPNYQEHRAKAADALWAWIVEDNKHTYGFLVTYNDHEPIKEAEKYRDAISSRIASRVSRASTLFGLDEDDKSGILVYKFRSGSKSLDVSSQHNLCRALDSGKSAFPRNRGQCLCVSFR